MWTTKYIAVRSLIWLAALAVPIQGLPAADCGCASSKKCCQGYEQSAGCCCSEVKVREGRCCCSGKRVVAERSCCCQVGITPDSSGCNCGSNCPCDQEHQPEPATPPVENEPSQKVVGEMASAISAPTTYQPDRPQSQHDASLEADFHSSLDRCACLCRFTL